MLRISASRQGHWKPDEEHDEAMSDDGKADSGDGEGADLQQLAKEYVDLWEQQIKAFSNDEALAKTMAQTVELMTAGAANVAAMMQQASGAAAKAGTGDDGRDDQGDGTGGSGAASAGTASGDPEPDVRELALRIAELEKRLSRLEGLAEPAGKVAPRKTAKR